MNNNFLLKKYDTGLSLNVNKYDNGIIDTNGVSRYKSYERSINKNHRICLWNENLNCNEDVTSNDNTGNDNSTTDTGTTDTSNTQTTPLKDSYETLYQNITSYDSHTDMTDSRYFIRVYQLPDNKEITVITNMRDFGKIVSSISGDTGYDRVLVKTTRYVKNSHIDTVYTYGGIN